MDRGAWWATVHGVHKKSDTTERLHFHFQWQRQNLGCPLREHARLHAKSVQLCPILCDSLDCSYKETHLSLSALLGVNGPTNKSQRVSGRERSKQLI